MTPDYDYGAQTSYTLQLFCYLFVIMLILYYWNDPKTGISFTGSYNFIKYWIWAHQN